MSDEFHIGQRLSYDSHLCTVRYVGAVKSTKGQWLGVEWDDPSRGKHDGEHDGIRYFKCLSNAPKPASFVRPSRKHDAPRTFVEALRFKYASEASDPNQVQDDASRVIRISGKVAEEVGFEKVRQQLADLQELRIVILDSLNVYRPLAELYRRSWESRRSGDEIIEPLNCFGLLLEIRNTCPRVTELDLSRNLFEDWLEVADTCDKLHCLRSLRCDGNRFQIIDMNNEMLDHFRHAFRNMETLSLTDTLLPWEELATIARTFTGLTSFAASRNQLGRLNTSLLPSSITTLVLENNSFTSFSDISPLRTLPNLRKLVLRSNDISTTHYQQESLPIFQPSLQDVDLSHNAISSWPLVTALSDAFPGLSSLRISDNPLYSALVSPDSRSMTADDGYMLTIARLPTITSLNYSGVSAKDRLNAETYYLSQIALELSTLEPGETEQQHLARHPRWSALCQEYGAPAIARKGTASDPNTLSSRLVQLRLKLDTSMLQRINEALLGYAQGAGNVMSISVPKRYSIYTIQGLVGRHLGVAPISVRLVWETGESDIVAVLEETSVEQWDSDADGEMEVHGGKDVKMREVELAAGTRPIGTWVDGEDVVLRVEYRILEGNQKLSQVK